MIDLLMYSMEVGVAGVISTETVLQVSSNAGKRPSGKAGKLNVRPERLELPTACSEDKCSVQLSYGRNFSQGVIIVYTATRERMVRKEKKVPLSRGPC